MTIFRKLYHDAADDNHAPFLGFVTIGVALALAVGAVIALDVIAGGTAS
jgi:hypothetical protein